MTTPIFKTGTPPCRFKMVYFLRGEDGKDALDVQRKFKEIETVKQVIEDQFPHVRFAYVTVPSLPILYHDLTGSGFGMGMSTDLYIGPFLLPFSLLVGIGGAGTYAAHLQERFPNLNLSVIAVNSPATYGFLAPSNPKNRVALYSSGYEPIKTDCNWAGKADITYDVSWLQNGVVSESGSNLCKYSVAFLIAAYMKDPDIKEAFARVLKDGEYEAYTS